MSAALARKLRRQSKRGFPKFRKKIGRGSQRLLVEVLLIADALFDRRWGEAAASLMVVAYDAAVGGERHECFCCCQPWAHQRRPVLFVGIEFLKAETGLACAVCGNCAIPAESVRERVIAAAARDLGLDRATAQHVGAAPGAVQ